MKKLVLIASLFLSTAVFSQASRINLDDVNLDDIDIDDHRKNIVDGYVIGKAFDEALKEAARIKELKERLQREGERERARIIREHKEHRDPSDRIKPPKKPRKNNDASAGWRRA